VEPIVIFVVLVTAFGVLAVRFGSDSRPRACSPEQRYAELGFTWGNRLSEFPRVRARLLPRRSEGWFRRSHGSSWLASDSQCGSRMVTRGR